MVQVAFIPYNPIPTKPRFARPSGKPKIIDLCDDSDNESQPTSYNEPDAILEDEVTSSLEESSHILLRKGSVYEQQPATEPEGPDGEDEKLLVGAEAEDRSKWKDRMERCFELNFVPR